MPLHQLARLLFDWTGDGVMLRAGAIGIVEASIDDGQRYVIEFTQLPRSVTIAANLVELFDGHYPVILQGCNNP